MNKVLSFFNLLDAEGNLSITNLAVIVVLVKLAISPSASLTEAGTLLIALANYAHKRAVNKNSQVLEVDPLKPQVDEISKKLEDMSSQVSALALSSGLTKVK